MKKKYYIFLLSIIILTIVFVTSYIYYGINTALSDAGQIEEIIVPGNEPEYHFSMICENLEDSLWLSVKNGVEKASEEFNVAVEFNGPNVVNGSDEQKYMNIAIASRLDGIITHVWDEKEAGELIDCAVEKCMPVVTIGTDAENSKRAAFVGVNAYDSGVQLGRMLLAAAGDQSNAAVLISKGQIDETVQKNLMILGIKDSVKDYPNIKITTIEYDSTDILNIEDTIRDLIQNPNGLDSIICTTSKDTTLVVQRLIDLNKMDYNIIGSGYSPQLLRYIDKRVVFGTVSADYEQMGYDAIKAMVQIKKIGRTSAYFKVNTMVITGENISEYIKSGEE
ncbi:substrate-binding domain-containing protein [Acetivibrio cellulolyticus]|uniref:substrate-binding domain-containing protein n=1 Tax=Acetivibrio cellulolyticus TaxID=35830 RepID=UPI0001E2DE83|nr:substrate-binding domain-containing protein [Acetivibrio cellulolyticus]